MSVKFTTEEVENGMTSKFVPTKVAKKLTPEEAAERGEGAINERVKRVVLKDRKKEAIVETKGREAKRLTKEEAEAVRQKEAEEAKKALEERRASINPANGVDELPVVTFPVKIRLANESFSGIVAGINFEDGMTNGWHPWRVVARMSAAGFPVFDQKTGVEISISAENLTFVAENKFWNYGQELPEHCQEDNEPATAPVTAKEGEKASGSAEEQPVEKDAAAGGDEKINPQKVEKLVTAIQSLRPGHKQDWTASGLPDCNRLSDLLEDARGDQDWDFSCKVNRKERDAAWDKFNRELMDAPKERIESAFKMPTEDNVKAILQSVVSQKGTRFLQQSASDLGIEKPAKHGPDIIDQMIEAGVTKEQAKSLI